MKPNAFRVACGTDFSRNAQSAAEVAAVIAARQGGKLDVIHVADETNSYGDHPAELRAFLRPIAARLRREARRLRAFGAMVEGRLLHGKWAEQALIESFEVEPPDLVVVSAVSKTAFDRWTVGSVSERVAQHALAPTLVVRASDRLVRWAQGARELNVVVAVDFSTSSDAALAWVDRLRRIGPCAVRLVHVQLASRRMPQRPPRDAPQAAGRTDQRALARDLRRKARRILGGADVAIQVEKADVSPDAVLVRAAADANADLLVTGTHQWRGVSRVLHRSTSRGVLRNAPMSVLCVPAPVAIPHGVDEYLEARRILAATDFSPFANRAVAWAYASAAGGRIVRLIHILPSGAPPSPLVTREPRRSARSQRHGEIADARRKLAMLVPATAAAGGIVTEIEVIEASDPARAILAETQRFGTDLLCIGSKGRGAAGGHGVGSVALQILGKDGPPVLLARGLRP